MLGTARKVLDFFEPADRWRLVGVVSAMTLAGLLQTAGVASIMPFLSLLANPDIVVENRWMAWAYDGLGFESAGTFLVFVGIAVLVLLVTTNAFSAFSDWITLRLVWSTHHRISERLLSKYLNQPYAFFLGRNTAKLSRSLLAEVQEIIKGVMIPCMEVLARGVTTAFIVLLLLLVDPLLAILAAAAIGGGYAAVYRLVRQKQRRLGIERHSANGRRFQTVAEAFGGIKDVKVLGRESHFLSRFADPSLRYSQARASNQVVSELPRYALESLAFGAIILIVIYLLETRGTLGDVLPVLGLYAMAGHRLMPALQRIFAGLTKIRFNVPALDRLHEEMGLAASGKAEGRLPERRPIAVSEQPAPPSVSLTREIRFVEVGFRYPDAPAPALQDIDLTISANQSVAFVGPTGSGKTTLVDLLLGLFEPTTGEIRVDDTVLSEVTLPAWRGLVGYVPQSIFLGDDTIAANIAFGVPEDQIDFAAVVRAGRAAHLDDFVRELPLGYETIIGERGIRLSGGERQRIGIARALYQDPAVLVMDEATSALDGVTEEAVMKAISALSQRKTIILIAHRLTTVRDCDTIFMLDCGRLAGQGTFESLAASSGQFRAMARQTASA